MRFKFTNSADQYGLISKTFHWVITLLFMGLFISGWYMVGLTYYDPLYYQLPWWHKNFGVLIIVFILFRLLWLFVSPRPALLLAHRHWENRLAQLTHRALLLLPLLVGVTGYLIISANTKGVDFFGWIQLPALVTSADIGTDWAGNSHPYLAYLTVAIVLLHCAGAIKHHLVDKDKTLKRMLPMPYKEHN